MAEVPGSTKPPVPLTEPSAPAPGAGSTWQRIREHKILSGTASVFAGDHAKGQAAASAALSLIPASRDALNRRYAAYLAARVYAWSGATDPSVALLEELATRVPGVGPATITRDPLFTIPLKDNPRCHTLKMKLEAQMAATKLK